MKIPYTYSTYFYLLILCHTGLAINEYFNEQLQLTPLPDGKLLAHFDFVTHMEAPTLQDHYQTESALLDYSLFPKVIGQVLQQYQVNALIWFLHKEDGIMMSGESSSSSSGTGVELWAWMKSASNVDQRWKSLTNVLSGLFCASLNFIDDTLTTEPRLSFQTNTGTLRYGALPHENVCTENLTPWIKLLPCKSKTGLAILLNPHKIYNSHFHSMSIHASSKCSDSECTKHILELKQTVTSVMDPVRETSRRDWSLASIFDKQLIGACPMATSSQVVVHQSHLDKYNLPQINPMPTFTNESLVIFDLHKVENHQPLDISMRWNENAFDYPATPNRPMIYANRYFTGYGQEHGGLRITLHNDHPTDSVSVIYLDTIPWFLKLYLHTFDIQITSISAVSTSNDYNSSTILQNMFYQPGIDRSRPNMLECLLNVPPSSIITMTIDFDKTFLKYTEHRPDANRGFDVGSAVFTINSTSRIYTDTLLVSLPTPDFSMPYNVITLTCTIIALFFGSIFNLLIRSFHTIEQGKEEENEK
ncbi:unnamed protein product [Cunninghamella echinulata]